MTKHTLKTWSKYFAGVYDGNKNFEVRKNDRGYRVGDVLELVEGDIVDGASCPTGRMIEKTVTYILNGGDLGIEKGYCVLGIQ